MISPAANEGTAPWSAWRVFERIATWLAIAALGLWSVRTTLGLAAIVLTERGIPLWDPAEHGHVAVLLANAIHRGDVLGFLAGLNRQVTWPFVDSLVRLPAFLVLGDGYESGDLVSTALYAGSLATLFLVGLKLHPTRGVPAACLLVALMLLSPMYLFMGTITMLEITGVFLLSLTLAFLYRAESGSEWRHFLRAAGIGSAALFLCKYNFGLLWLLPLGLHESFAAWPDWRARLWRGTSRLIRGLSRPRPFTVFIFIYVAALLGILITGGGEIRIGGHSISLRTPWHLAYYLYVIFLIRLFLRWRKDPEGLGAAWRTIPERLRVLLVSAGLPLAVWFLIPYPNRVRAFFRFVINRQESVSHGVLHRLTFYPQAFANDYAPTPLLGYAILILAVIPPPPSGNRRDLGRLLYLAFWVAFLAAALHGYQQPRFFFIAALLAWLRAAHSTVWFIEYAMAAFIKSAAVRGAAWGAGLLALVGGGLALAPDLAQTRAAHHAFESPAGFGAVLESITREVIRSDRPAVLLGCSNRLSAPLVAWQFSRTRPEVDVSRVPERLPWLPSGSDESLLQQRIDLIESRGKRIVAALPTIDSPLLDAEYRAEVWADSAVVYRLVRSGDLVCESDTLFGDVGVRVRAFHLRMK